MKIHYFLFSFCLLTFYLPIASKAQEIKVLSKDNHTPLSGIPVSIQQIGNKSGEFSVLTNEAGSIDLSAKRLTYPIAINIKSSQFIETLDTFRHPENKSYYLCFKPNQLNTVVVTGQYAPGTMDNSVHVVKVINREMIDQMAAQDLREALGRSLNIRLSQDNILGSSMSLQGISGENVKILIDGVPIIGRQNGNLDLSQINMNDVSRIEVVEGPLSVNYGTDALAGTINIITQKTQPEPWLTQADLYYESNGTYNASGKVGYQFEGNTIQLTIGRNYFDGWNPGERPFEYQREIRNDSSRSFEWKPKEQYFASLAYGRKIKEMDLRLSSRLFDETIINRGLPRAPYGETALDDRYKTIRFDNALSLNGKINDNYRGDFVLSYNLYRRDKNTFLKDLTNLTKELTQGSGDQDTSTFNAFMFRGDITSTKARKINYELGYDLNFETNSGAQIEGQNKNIGDFALFSTAQYSPVSKLIIKPGLRVAYNTKFKAPLIPSLNLKYDISLGDKNEVNNLILRASYAKGFRAPSLKELYFDFVDANHDIHGNPDLKAERSNNFIFNVVYGKFKGETGFKFEWNNYYNQIENLITLAQLSPTSALYTYANIGHYQTLGTSLAAEFSHEGFRISLSGGLMGVYNQLHETDATAQKYSSTPEFTSNLSYDWKQTGLSFALYYKYTGKLPGYYVDANDEVRQNTVQSYNMADFSVSKMIWNKKLRLTAGSKNLFNITNITGVVSDSPHSGGSSFSTPLSMGRTYFMGISLNLNYK